MKKNDMLQALAIGLGIASSLVGLYIFVNKANGKGD